MAGGLLCLLVGGKDHSFKPLRRALILFKRLLLWPNSFSETLPLRTITLGICVGHIQSVWVQGGGMMCSLTEEQIDL